ncbi:MAG TPA: adenine deaminase C-terminal domain-containing protein [Conexibacter sp.]|nr:adenine deaminase C-terminal domain-containing protein [Conexibacter sp.]
MSTARQTASPNGGPSDARAPGGSPFTRERLIDVALGHAHADVVVRGGTLLDVHAGTVRRADVAVADGRIAAVGDVAYAAGPETETIDATGTFVTPGLVCPHVHQWHSGQNGTVFARCLLEHGTTAATDGFYGPGMVAGARGVRFFLDEVLRTPLRLLFLVPTYAYVQNRIIGQPPTPGGVTPEQMLEMLDWPETHGVEETGYEFVCRPRAERDPALLAVIERALARRLVVCGHGPALPGERELNAWMAAGFSANHEMGTVEETVQQAQLGMRTQLREGPAMRDMRQVVRAITERRLDPRAFQICADLTTAESLFEGQQDEAVREAIRCGLDPLTAIRLSTIQSAEYFGASQDVGVVAPGRFADLVLVRDRELARYEIERVVAGGRTVVERGEWTGELEQPEYPAWLYETMAAARPIGLGDLRVPADAAEGSATVRAIGISDAAMTTEERVTLPVRDGAVQADPAWAVNKIALVDRMHGTGACGAGFVVGFGMRAGAVASSINFNQGIVAVGADDASLVLAVNTVIELGGGIVVVRDGAVVAAMPTPLLGMASELPYDDARARAVAVMREWRALGCTLDSPLASIEFVCDAKYPAMRISTDGPTRVELDAHGNVDLSTLRVVPVLVEPDGAA